MTIIYHLLGQPVPEQCILVVVTEKIKANPLEKSKFWIFRENRTNRKLFGGNRFISILNNSPEVRFQAIKPCSLFGHKFTTQGSRGSRPALSECIVMTMVFVKLCLYDLSIRVCAPIPKIFANFRRIFRRQKSSQPRILKNSL